MTNKKSNLGNLDRHIRATWPKWDIPGVAVAVVKDDEVVFAKGYGVRRLGGNEPVDEHTIFAIGSITKGFTATALGMLVQEGKIAWDDAVTKYLPKFQMYDPYVTHEMKIRDLLCHRSGLGTWAGDLAWYGSLYSCEEVIERVRFIPPAFSFRAGFGYSNIMFATAGLIIPAVTGLSWKEFVEQRLLTPLGMSRTSTTTHALTGIQNVAAPHEVIRNKVKVVPYRNIDSSAPAGAINSSVWDMAQWIRLQLNGGTYAGKRLVEESVIEETRTPHNPLPIPPAGKKLVPSRHFLAYGLGWELLDYHGRLVVRHGGGIDGMISLLGLVPEEKLGIVVLTNKSPNNNPFEVLYHVIDAFLGAPRKDWNKILLEMDREYEAEAAKQMKQVRKVRLRSTRPTLPLEGYAGTYRDPIYGEATISLKGERLVLQLSAHPDTPGRLEHWHYDTFLCRWRDPVFGESLVPFILDGQGKVEEFRLKVREDMLDPLEYKFKRVPAKPA